MTASPSTPGSETPSGPRSALTAHLDAREVARDLIAQFGAMSPCVVLFFCSWKHDGAAISAELRAEWPDARVLGCTTAGAFTESDDLADGVSAFALGSESVGRCAVALADYEQGDAEQAVAEAMRDISRQLDLDLRTATPDRYVGIVLQDGLGGDEEAVGHALGVAAPTVPFIGGSAGDAIRFVETPVFVNESRSARGAALLLMEMAAPFATLKSQSAEPTGRSLTVTEMDRTPGGARIVRAFDGRPAAEAYAEATGLDAETLDTPDFLQYPLGLMEGDQPWLRSPVQLVDGGGLRFLCELGEGIRYEILHQTDLVGGTRADIDAAVEQMGAPLSGALVFNCVYRRLQMDAAELHAAHRSLYDGIEAAGFHTYGETYLGHVNQTSVMLLVGEPGEAEQPVAP